MLPIYLIARKGIVASKFLSISMGPKLIIRFTFLFISSSRHGQKVFLT